MKAQQTGKSGVCSSCKKLVRILILVKTIFCYTNLLRGCLFKRQHSRSPYFHGICSNGRTFSNCINADILGWVRRYSASSLYPFQMQFRHCWFFCYSGYKDHLGIIEFMDFVCSLIFVKHNASQTGSVSVVGWRGERSCCVESVTYSCCSHWLSCAWDQVVSGKWQESLEIVKMHIRHHTEPQNRNIQQYQEKYPYTGNIQTLLREQN
jgi:hypothetical protein